MACSHKTDLDTDAGNLVPKIYCEAINEPVEVDSCPVDETTCPFAVAITNGHHITRAYDTGDDYERPRYENPLGTDVTNDRYIGEKQPRPISEGWETRMIFDVQPGDIRIQGSPHDE